ncbi:hypothetical protein HMSSN036_41850 [Paenibacillus macerans]|nr:hypothetical protein HMSSN036_41850 [Paenibacillus macerans]
MGISDGSAFAVTLCMAFMPGTTNMGMIGYSLAGSALGACLVFGLSRVLPGGSSPVMLAVLGTLLGTFLGGVSQALASYFQVSQNISFWYNARLHDIAPEMLWLAVPFGIFGLLLALLLARPVTALALGDELASELGLNVKLIKAAAMLGVVVMTGAPWRSRGNRLCRFDHAAYYAAFGRAGLPEGDSVCGAARRFVFSLVRFAQPLSESAVRSAGRRRYRAVWRALFPLLDQDERRGKK